MGISEGRAFQTEGTASTKALRQTLDLGGGGVRGWEGRVLLFLAVTPVPKSKCSIKIA